MKAHFHILLLKYALLFGAYFVLQNSSSAQSDSLIRIVHANEWSFEKGKYNGAQLLKGKVEIFHDGATLWCDSAFLFKKTNSVQAFGNVHVNQGDSIELWGDEINYEGNSSYLKMIAYHDLTVKVKTDSATLYSKEIEYFRKQGQVVYTKHGYLVTESGKAQLWSKKGTYFEDGEKVLFEDSVRVVQEDIEVITRRFIFFPNSNRAVFTDSATIYLEDRSQGVFTQNGWYDIQNYEGIFYDQSYWFSGSKKLFGDTLSVSDQGKEAKGMCNVQLQDTTEKLSVFSNHMDMFQGGKYAEFTGGVWTEQYSGSERLNIFSPKLNLYTDSTDGKTLFWTPEVRLFSPSFSSKADTLLYAEKDSAFTWYGNPVLWNDESQITGSTIRLQLANNNLDYLYIPTLGFMASAVAPLGEYNQVSGKSITGYFHDNELDSMLVEGNGESMYFALDDKDSSLIGLNQAAGSSILIKMDSSKIQDIEFLTQPSSTMYPEKDIQQTTLKRFHWRGDERPKKPTDIIFWMDNTPMITEPDSLAIPE